MADKDLFISFRNKNMNQQKESERLCGKNDMRQKINTKTESRMKTWQLEIIRNIRKR